MGWLYVFEPGSFGGHLVNPLEHSIQEIFSGGRWYAFPLKLVDFIPLPVDMDPHQFDFISNVVEFQHSRSAANGGTMRT